MAKGLSDAERRIQELEDRIQKLERVLKNGCCKKCGGASWDIPLMDYCSCGLPRPETVKETMTFKPTKDPQ